MKARSRRPDRQAGNVILSSVLVVLALGLSAVGAAQLVRSRLDGAAEIRRSSFAALQARQISEGVVSWALVRLNDASYSVTSNLLPSSVPASSDSVALTTLPAGVTISSTLGDVTPTLTAAFTTTPASLAENAVVSGTTTLEVTSTVTATVGGVATSYPYTQRVRLVQASGSWEARR